MYVSSSSEVEKIVKLDPDDRSPQIKFCGDGTKVSRVKNYVVLSCSKITFDGSNHFYRLPREVTLTTGGGD